MTLSTILKRSFKSTIKKQKQNYSLCKVQILENLNQNQNFFKSSVDQKSAILKDRQKQTSRKSAYSTDPREIPRARLSQYLQLTYSDLGFRINNNIYVKNYKILLNLNNNKYIIDRDKIYVIDMDQVSFTKHLSLFKNEIEDKITTLPFFEFQALEFLLNFAVNDQENYKNSHIEMVKTLALQANPSCDDHKIRNYHKNKNTGKLSNLQGKDGLVDDLTILRLLDDEKNLIQQRIQENERLIELLTEITDDEEFLKEFLISNPPTTKLQLRMPTVPTGNETVSSGTNTGDDRDNNLLLSTDLIDEMEQLLDIYLMKLQDINDTYSRLESTIGSSVEIIQLKQDIFRNEIMLENLALNRLQVAIVLVGLVFAAFGMNMRFGFSESENSEIFPFYIVVVIGFFSILVIKSYLARKGQFKSKKIDIVKIKSMVKKMRLGVRK